MRERPRFGEDTAAALHSKTDAAGSDRPGCFTADSEQRGPGAADGSAARRWPSYRLARAGADRTDLGGPGHRRIKAHGFPRFGISTPRATFTGSLRVFTLRPFSNDLLHKTLNCGLVAARGAVVCLRALFPWSRRGLVCTGLTVSGFILFSSELRSRRSQRHAWPWKGLAMRSCELAYESANQVEEVIAIGAVAAARRSGATNV